MKIRTGIDIIEVDRIQEAIESQKDSLIKYILKMKLIIVAIRAR